MNVGSAVNHIEPMLVECWASVDEGAPAVNHHWFNVCCLKVSQLTQGIDPMLFYCWADIEDGGPTLKQHCVNALSRLRASFCRGIAMIGIERMNITIVTESYKKSPSILT